MSHEQITYTMLYRLPVVLMSTFCGSLYESWIVLVSVSALCASAVKSPCR